VSNSRVLTEGIAVAGESAHTLKNMWLQWGSWQSATNASQICHCFY